MNILSITKLTKNGRDEPLFSDVTFGLDYGEKCAIIGKNGCGKSTMIKIIAGKLPADAGIVSINKEAGISYLPQDPDFNPNDTIREHIFKSDSYKVKIIREYEELCEKIGTDRSEVLQKRFEFVMTQMENENIWDYENEIKSILSILGLDNLNLKMSSLSGGMLKKVELAHTLIEDTKILLLDEPTNHLDIRTIAWLEDYLSKTTKTVLMVTHDRYFLDKICTSIYEIENKSLRLYKGNFSYYLEKKEELDHALVRNEAKIESILRKEMEWLRRGPKARGTKAKARKDMIYKMIDREKLAVDKGFSFEIEGRRLGSKILEIENINKRYADKILINDFSYVFKKGERLGIFGENGTGKTTFLSLCTGESKPDSGKIVAGQNTVFSYYKQYPNITNKEMTVIEYIKEAGEIIRLPDGTDLTASKLLERFGFSGKIQYSSLQALSGGEKKRVYLVRLLISNPNFLILDEPTNDFDIYTLSVLEDFLDTYSGCLLVVSHDRYFMDRTVDSLLIFGNKGEISGFAGKCSEYIDYLADENIVQEKEQIQVKNKVIEKNNDDIQSKRKLSYNEEKEFASLEKSIEALENKKVLLENNMSSGETDHNKLKQWGLDFDKIVAELEEKYARWESLAQYK